MQHLTISSINLRGIKLKTILFLLVVIVLHISCSEKTRGPAVPASSKNPPTLQSLLPDVKTTSNKDIENFIIKIQPVTDSTLIRKRAITGIVSITTIIDQQGKAKKLIIKKSINPVIDKLVTKAINNSEFIGKKNITGKSADYFIDLTYIFYHGNILTPLANGLSINRLTKKTETPTEENGTFEFFAVSDKPLLTKRPTPYYSDEARRSGAKGKVMVMVTIGKDGTVKNLDILRADHDLLIISTLDAAAQC